MPQVPLGRKASCKTLRHFIKFFLRENPTFPSFKGFYVCKLFQVRKLVPVSRRPFSMIQCSLYLFENFSAHTDQTKMPQASHLFHAWKHRDGLSSAKGPYKPCHYNSRCVCAAHYRSGHCRYCVVYAAHCDNRDHLALGDSLLPPASATSGPSLTHRINS